MWHPWTKKDRAPQMRTCNICKNKKADDVYLSECSAAPWAGPKLPPLSWHCCGGRLSQRVEHSTPLRSRGEGTYVRAYACGSYPSCIGTRDSVVRRTACGQGSNSTVRSFVRSVNTSHRSANALLLLLLFVSDPRWILPLSVPRRASFDAQKIP